MVQQGGGLGIAQTVILVHGFGHQAAVQLGKVGFHGLFHGGAVLAARLFLGRTEGVCRFSGVAEQHFAGRRKIDLFQRTVPPLGEQVERCQRIDLVIPVFDTGGLTHIGGVNVHDVAADAELARAVHLTAADVPGGEQPRRQGFAVVDHPGLEGQGVFQELVPGNGVLEQGFGGDADGVQPPAREGAEDRQPPVFVLAARALHRAEHEVPGREHRRRQAEGLEIVGKMGRFGLTGRHDAERPAKVFLQGRIQQGAARRGQTEQRCGTRCGKACRNFLVLCRVFQQGFVHRGPPLLECPLRTLRVQLSQGESPWQDGQA